MGLADKDLFPTPEIKDSKGETFVWPGPGVTVREFTVIQMCIAIAGKYAGVFDENDIADMAVKQADALIRRLEEGESDEEA